MHVSNLINQNDVLQIAKTIQATIAKSPQLTTRNIREIIRLIEHENVFIAFDENTICGFIIRQEIYKDWYELKSWFVVPSYRKQGVGKALFHAASKDNVHYFGVTFQDDISTRVQNFGYKESHITDLPLPVRIRYILSRHISSIFRHYKTSKSTLLIKQ